LLNVPDENTATITLLNSLFSVEGRYFGYFIYGVGMNLETPPVELFVDKSTKKRIKNE
jgi:hypothetical protein